MTVRRLPIEPLLELALARYATWAVSDDPTVASALELDDVALAVYLNVNSDSLGRWRRRGWIGEPQAEAAAFELGYHPVTVWPVDWFADLELEDA